MYVCMPSVVFIEKVIHEEQTSFNVNFKTCFV